MARSRRHSPGPGQVGHCGPVRSSCADAGGRHRRRGRHCTGGHTEPLTSVSTDAVLRSLALARMVWTTSTGCCCGSCRSAANRPGSTRLKTSFGSPPGCMPSPAASTKCAGQQQRQRRQGESRGVLRGDDGIHVGQRGGARPAHRARSRNAATLQLRDQMFPELMAKRCAADMVRHISVRDRLVERWLVVFDRIWSRLLRTSGATRVCGSHW